MAYFADTPGMADQSFWERTPNIFPAGDAPWMKDQPTITAEPASMGVIKNRNQMWLDPGMYMEMPSGYGGQGPSSALFNIPQFPFFGFPGFGLPPLAFGPGGFGVPPPPFPQGTGGEGAAAEPDYLGTAMKLGGNILKTFSGPSSKSGGTITARSNDYGVTLQGDPSPMNPWGYNPEGEPVFSLEGPKLQSPFDPASFDLGVTPLNIPDFGPGDMTGITMGGDITPRNPWGYSPKGDPTFSLTNPVLEGPTFDPASFTLDAPIIPPQPGWIAPTAAVGVAAPALTRAFTDDPQTNVAMRGFGAGAQLAATIGMLGSAGTAGAAGATGLTGLTGILNPATAVVALPFILGPALKAITGPGGLGNYGHAAVPPGFIEIPGYGGKYVNPMTGVTIQRKGRYDWELTDQAQEGRAVTPEQARSWNIPIPGVDIPFDILHPEIRERITRRNDLLGSESSDLRRPGVTRDERGNVLVTAPDVNETFFPGYSIWNPIVEEKKRTMPDAPESRIWHATTTDPRFAEAREYMDMLQILQDQRASDRGR